RRGPPERVGPRDRDSGRGPVQPIRALPPRPQRRRPALLRSGPRAVHLPRHRRAARRSHLGGERPGAGHHDSRRPAAGRGPAGFRGRGMSAPPILVVDDDPGILAVVAEALDLEGYAVRTATNGAEALALVAEERPRLVLLDM